MGVVVGVIIIILGLTSIVHYSIATNINGRYLFAGFGCILVGSLFLLKSVPAFIPLKTKTQPSVRTCPNCGSIVEEDTLVCQKCKRQL
jgi:hypothetical protein